MTSLARLLYDLYFEGATHYATGDVNGKGEVFYTPVEGIPTLELVEQHLAGEVVLGAYTVLPGNYVRFLAFDVDSQKDPEKAKEIARKIHDYLGTIPHAISWSGGKGYHCNVYLKGMHPAQEVKQIGDTIRDNLGLPKSGEPHVEVYPKQAELTKAHPRGSLIRLPLGIHPKTKNQSKFVDPEHDWVEVKPDTALEQRADIQDLHKKLEEGGTNAQLVGLFAQYWLSGQRHDMALFTAGLLSSYSWTEEAVMELIKAIYEQVGTGDANDWHRAVRDTFTKVYAGENVIGLAGLAKIIPQAVLQQITDLASKQVFSATLKIIDGIRLGKGQQWEKVRKASRAIISFFRENGKLVRDNDDIYWLDSESKKLLKFVGAQWDRFAHNEFGLNPYEAFGKQVAESVKLAAYKEAEVVQIHKRSHWDNEQFWLNLGGPEVYVFNGNPSERRVAWNGENKILFLNSDDPMSLPNLLEADVEPISPWPFLADGLNFAPGESVNASPIQQREMFKAFVMGILFAEELPTRPILTLLGLTGSGKTSAARNVLRLLEGPHEDVSQIYPDKPDALRASMEAHKVIVLDNLEKTKATWLTDTLNRSSTGSNLQLRVLHTTNTMRNVRLDNYLLLTATSMPFTDETVFSRILPIQLAQISSYKSEHQMQVYLLENYKALWKGLLDDIDKVVAQLRANRTSEVPIESRLADFTVFCNRIKEADFINGKELMVGLSNLVNRQKTVLAETSTFVEIFIIWDKTRSAETVRFMSMAELYPYIQRAAGGSKIEFPWSSSQGLSKHITMLEPVLIQFYGLETRKTIIAGREVKQYKFNKMMLPN